MSTSPRILVLFGNVPLLGQERANIEALHVLQDAGCKVRFLIRAEYTFETIQRELNWRGIEFVTVAFYDAIQYGKPLTVWWKNITGIASGSWQLLRQIRQHRATHIHVGSVSNILNFLPALMLTRLPLVFRAGDVPPTHHALWRWVWRYSRRRASHFVCDSEFIQAKLGELGVSAEKTSIVYAPAPRRKTVIKLVPRSCSADTNFSVLYLGQITYDKGVHLFVEAAIELCRIRSDIRFVIAGAYDWRNVFAEELIDRVRGLGLIDRICFTGFVEDIDELLVRSQLHVCPSLCDEAYGLTVVEAKVRQLPSVVFSSGGLSELITHGVDGFVCKEKSAAALRQAIEEYANQPELAARQGLAALASLERLGIRAFAQKWCAVYQADSVVTTKAMSFSPLSSSNHGFIDSDGDNRNELKSVRVLTALNGLELFGHELGNIEVFKVLRSLGAEVIVGVNAIENGGAVGQHLRNNGFETFPIPFGNQWSWLWLKRYPLSSLLKIKEVLASSLIFWGAIKRFQPTHIHLGSPLAYSYLLPALASTRCQLIYRMGDAPPIDSPFNLRIWRMAIHKSTKLVSVSQFVRRVALQAGGKNATVIYNLAPVRNDLATVARKANNSGVPPRLVYVGAVAENKGLVPLIEATAQLLIEFPCLELDIVGGSRYDVIFRNHLHALIASKQIGKNVIFHGYVSDTSALYQRADIHVAPSICDEALGNVVLEAKCAGTSSVVFPSGGLPEMINHQVDGYVCYEKSTAALVEALRWMLADTGRLRRMGDAARADSAARFGPERFAREWADVYRVMESAQP